MITYTQKNFDSHIELLPAVPAIGSFIWLHGLGADGTDFLPLVTELNLPDHLPLRFIFPHAPMRPVTLNNGHVMRAWFDLHTLDFASKVDYSGIEKSIAFVQNTIAHELEHSLPADHIIIGGFSQGAALALLAGLSYPRPLAGIIALSGGLPFTKGLDMKDKLALPIFIGHGTEDDIVPIALGLQTANELKKQGCTVNWHAYEMAHSVCNEELDDMRQWVLSIFSK